MSIVYKSLRSQLLEGRIVKHLAQPVRYKGELMTTRQMYATFSPVAKRRATLLGRRGGERRGYVMVNEQDYSLDVPKIVFDSIDVPDISG